MANPVTVTTRPLYEQANTNVHGAWDLRQSLATSPGAGVAGYEDFRVMQKQSGATMDVDIGKTAVGLMEAWVRGSTITAQGLYKITNIDWTSPTASAYNTQIGVTVGANATGNPRLDMVVLEVLDNQHAGSTFLAQIRVVAGTASAAATLDTRTGAAAVPTSAILLADVIVANGAVSIVTANIRDRRAFPLAGVIPPLLTDTDQVAFDPHRSLAVELTAGAYNVHNNQQVAVLSYLPRRIVGANRINWRYTQASAAAINGSYVLAVFDASGRALVNTGSVAFTGAANTVQLRSEVIAPTTFEAGWYYSFLGLGGVTAGAVNFQSTVGAAAINNSPRVIAANIWFTLTPANGLIVPSAILGFTDVTTFITTGTDLAGGPIITLSVV